MKKKLIIIVFLSAFAVPYGAKLLARKDKVITRLKRELKEVNEQITTLEKQMDKVERRCEQEQTSAICDFTSQQLTQQGLHLWNLKSRRDDLQRRIKKQEQTLKRSK